MRIDWSMVLTVIVALAAWYMVGRFFLGKSAAPTTGQVAPVETDIDAFVRRRYPSAV